ncbi:MAG: hypothetical protein KC635_08130 [Myxococcales bacterium]|nr:hypothetical protein [Myxococcales bacterium]MCB9736411.1 hypothetical protein [Deltaproteobacteria bacterium]
MRRWGVIWACAFPFALLAACGGDGGAGEATGAAGDTAAPDGLASDATADTADGDDGAAFAIVGAVQEDALADALGRARCAFDARCGVGFAGVPAESCVRLAGAYSWYAEAVDRMIGRGMVYDADAMGDCLRYLAARPCDEVGPVNRPLGDRDDGRDYFLRVDELDWYPVAACRRALLGGRAAGEGCLYHVECASGRCSGDGSQSCGVCVAPSAACDWFDQCGVDGICDLATGACVARAARGEACRGDRECRAGLRCDGGDLATGTYGVCAGLGEPGRACDDANFGSAWCPLGSRCYGSTCVAVPALFADAGEPCGPYERAATCLPDATCDSAGGDGESRVCARRGVGDDCRYDNPRVSPLARTDGCPIELVCDDDQTCAEPAALGASCRSSRDCASGAFCEPESRRCVARLGEGATCSAYPAGQECAYPYTCVGSRLFGTDDGTCAVGADPGADCVGKEDCGPDLECSSEGRCYAVGAYFGCR